MKRLLCIIASMNSGGAETFLMKVYRKLDKTKYQMDFCINVKEKCFYEDEITSLGGKIFRIPSKSESLSKFKKQLYTLIKSNKYEYVLRNTSSSFGMMDLKIAKKAGAKICSARSTNSSDGNSLFNKLTHKIGRLLYQRFVDVKFAPSILAAKYTFGKKLFANGEVALLHNAVDLDIYKYYPQERKLIRKLFNLEDKLVVGHVGRFCLQKNHMFLLDVFNEIKKVKDNAVLVLVGGNGNLEEEVHKKITQLGLNDSVIFTGIRSDIPQLMSAMDVFVMPSFYEGMPNTVIEAQATGLPCVIADTITKEANITGLVTYLPLREPNRWAQKVLSLEEDERIDTKQIFLKEKYDVESTVQTFIDLVFGSK